MTKEQAQAKAREIMARMDFMSSGDTDIVARALTDAWNEAIEACEDVTTEHFEALKATGAAKPASLTTCHRISTYIRALKVSHD